MPEPLDLTGKEFGGSTVVCRESVWWKVRCRCGTEYTLSGRTIRNYLWRKKQPMGCKTCALAASRTVRLRWNYCGRVA
jgi:hypothetical protein